MKPEAAWPPAQGSVGRGQGLRICISYKIPVWGPHSEKPWLWSRTAQVQIPALPLAIHLRRFEEAWKTTPHDKEPLAVPARNDVEWTLPSYDGTMIRRQGYRNLER